MIFLRTLFGNVGRRLKVNNDIKFVMNAKYPIDFICYTYGSENHKQLIDLGIKSKLLCNEPMIFPDKQLWGHKMYAWKEMSKAYDQFLYLDWDMALTRPLPSNFEDTLKDKRFQAHLRIYCNEKCRWRKEHRRKCPCASWLWFGHPEVAKEIWRLWIEMGKPRKEEAVLSRYTEFPKNVLDLEIYKTIIEPEYFWLSHENVFKRSENEKPLFMHYNTSMVSKYLKRLSKVV